MYLTTSLYCIGTKPKYSIDLFFVICYGFCTHTKKKSRDRRLPNCCLGSTCLFFVFFKKIKFIFDDFKLIRIKSDKIEFDMKKYIVWYILKNI